MIAYYYIKCWHFIWLAYLTMSYLICPPTPTQTWFSAIINNFVMIIFVKKKYSKFQNISQKVLTLITRVSMPNYFLKGSVILFNTS